MKMVVMKMRRMRMRMRMKMNMMSFPLYPVFISSQIISASQVEKVEREKKVCKD